MSTNSSDESACETHCSVHSLKSLCVEESEKQQFSLSEILERSNECGVVDRNTNALSSLKGGTLVNYRRAQVNSCSSRQLQSSNTQLLGSQNNQKSANPGSVSSSRHRVRKMHSVAQSGASQLPPEVPSFQNFVDPNGTYFRPTSRGGGSGIMPPSNRMRDTGSKVSAAIGRNYPQSEISVVQVDGVAYEKTANEVSAIEDTVRGRPPRGWPNSGYNSPYQRPAAPQPTMPLAAESHSNMYAQAQVHAPGYSVSNGGKPWARQQRVQYRCDDREALGAKNMNLNLNASIPNFPNHYPKVSSHYLQSAPADYYNYPVQPFAGNAFTEQYKYSYPQNHPANNIQQGNVYAGGQYYQQQNLQNASNQEQNFYASQYYPQISANPNQLQQPAVNIIRVPVNFQTLPPGNSKCTRDENSTFMSTKSTIASNIQRLPAEFDYSKKPKFDKKALNAAATIPSVTDSSDNESRVVLRPMTFEYNSQVNMKPNDNTGNFHSAFKNTNTQNCATYNTLGDDDTITGTYRKLQDTVNFCSPPMPQLSNSGRRKELSNKECQTNMTEKDIALNVLNKTRFEYLDEDFQRLIQRLIYEKQFRKYEEKIKKSSKVYIDTLKKSMDNLNVCATERSSMQASNYLQQPKPLSSQQGDFCECCQQLVSYCRNANRVILSCNNSEVTSSHDEDRFHNLSLVPSPKVGFKSKKKKSCVVHGKTTAVTCRTPKTIFADCENDSKSVCYKNSKAGHSSKENTQSLPLVNLEHCDMFEEEFEGPSHLSKRKSPSPGCFNSPAENSNSEMESPAVVQIYHSNDIKAQLVDMCSQLFKSKPPPVLNRKTRSVKKESILKSKPKNVSHTNGAHLKSKQLKPIFSAVVRGDNSKQQPKFKKKITKKIVNGRTNSRSQSKGAAKNRNIRSKEHFLRELIKLVYRISTDSGDSDIGSPEKYWLKNFNSHNASTKKTNNLIGSDRYNEKLTKLFRDLMSSRSVGEDNEERSSDADTESLSDESRYRNSNKRRTRRITKRRFMDTNWHCPPENAELLCPGTTTRVLVKLSSDEDNDNNVRRVVIPKISVGQKYSNVENPISVAVEVEKVNQPASFAFKTCNISPIITASPNPRSNFEEYNSQIPDNNSQCPTPNKAPQGPMTVRIRTPKRSPLVTSRAKRFWVKIAGDDDIDDDVPILPTPMLSTPMESKQLLETPEAIHSPAERGDAIDSKKNIVIAKADDKRDFEEVKSIAPTSHEKGKKKLKIKERKRVRRKIMKKTFQEKDTNTEKGNSLIRHNLCKEYDEDEFEDDNENTNASEQISVSNSNNIATPKSLTPVVTPTLTPLTNKVVSPKLKSRKTELSNYSLGNKFPEKSITSIQPQNTFVSLFKGFKNTKYKDTPDQKTYSPPYELAGDRLIDTDVTKMMQFISPPSKSPLNFNNVVTDKFAESSSIDEESVKTDYLYISEEEAERLGLDEDAANVIAYSKFRGGLIGIPPHNGIHNLDRDMREEIARMPKKIEINGKIVSEAVPYMPRRKKSFLTSSDSEDERPKLDETTYDEIKDILAIYKYPSYERLRRETLSNHRNYIEEHFRNAKLGLCEELSTSEADSSVEDKRKENDKNNKTTQKQKKQLYSTGIIRPRFGPDMFSSYPNLKETNGNNSNLGNLEVEEIVNCSQTNNNQQEIVIIEEPLETFCDFAQEGQIITAFESKTITRKQRHRKGRAPQPPSNHIADNWATALNIAGCNGASQGLAIAEIHCSKEVNSSVLGANGSRTPSQMESTISWLCWDKPSLSPSVWEIGKNACIATGNENTGLEGPTGRQLAINISGHQSNNSRQMTPPIVQCTLAAVPLSVSLVATSAASRKARARILRKLYGKRTIPMASTNQTESRSSVLNQLYKLL